MVLKARNAPADYVEKLRAFQPNARLYLLNVILAGAAMGIFRLLFNYYLQSLSYDDAFIGLLVTVNSFTALLVALPMGYIADLIGRKASLLVGSLGVALAVLVMVLWHSGPVFITMNVLMGMAQALAGVTMGPFLMENSHEKERTYLFSFGTGMQMVSASVGAWLGGSLPLWMAGSAQVPVNDSSAYGLSLLVAAGGTALAALPLFFLRRQQIPRSQRSAFAPLSYLFRHLSLLGKLVVPMLVTSIGAGMIMPFINVFYRQVYLQSDQTVGALSAWGSLAMGVGLMIAPPLADRLGKIQLVVITQGLSIPFLVLMGFSPLFTLSAAAYLIRLALMNMSGPVYQTFVMERAEASARATVASLVSMSNSVGWAFSPLISGELQVSYGFGPAFGTTIVLYVISIFLYWLFFWRNRPQAEATREFSGEILEQ